MSHQKKYFYQFTSLDGKVNVVELHWDTATTITAEEVKATAAPFFTELPDIDHKFQTIRGTGCEINLFSTTDSKFFDGLYHVGMKEYMVKHYVNSVLNWMGYLNPELVRETFSDQYNYPFQITGNDGMAILDRMLFVGEDGIQFTGTKSIYEIITIILNKIGLPYTHLNVALSTNSTELTVPANQCPLNVTFESCANFIDEDGVAFETRRVLEGVLNQFGAVITLIGAEYYIIDINYLATGGAIYFKHFANGSTTASDVSKTFEIDLTAIGYMGTGSEKERSGGKNKQVVLYSPYPQSAALPEITNDLTQVDPVTLPVVWQNRNSVYFYKLLYNHDVINTYSPAQFELSYYFPNEVEADASSCLFWVSGATPFKVMDLKVNPFVVIGGTIPTYESGVLVSRGVQIKISGEAFLRAAPANVGGLALRCTIRIGGMHYVDTGEYIGATPGGWVVYPGSPQGYHYIQIKLDGGPNLQDQWVPFEWLLEPDLLPVDVDLGGDFYFDIYSDYEFQTFAGTKSRNPTQAGNDIRIRKMAVTFVNGDTLDEVGSTDIEYVGYLDRRLKEEAKKIELICGTDVTGIDRGKMMKYSGGVYSSIKLWNRASQTFKIEELLLNSLSSNYRFGLLSLSSMKLENKFHQLNTITDSVYLPGSMMMVKGMKVDYYNNLIEASFEEITPDELTIEP